jgi:putative FmdB family regulatory protein
MATYEYKCEVCNSIVSVTNPISEEIKIPKCLACKKDMVRIFNAPGLSFKGIGWGSDR